MIVGFSVASARGHFEYNIIFINNKNNLKNNIFRKSFKYLIELGGCLIKSFNIQINKSLI